jgi:hypothetical protein
MLALSILLTALLTSITSRKHKDKERFNHACDALRSAFNQELAALKSPSCDNPVDPYMLLVASFDKHRTAIEEFRPFIKKSRQRKFDQAWRNYYAYDNTGEESTEFLLKYAPGWEQKPIWELRALATANIEVVIEFAK